MYDAFAPANANTTGGSEMFALWWDRSQQQLYLLTGLLSGSGDSAQMLLSLESQFAVNIDGILQAYPPFADAITTAPALPPVGFRWVPATPKAIAKLGRSSPNNSLPKTPSVSFAKAAICDPNTCPGAQMATAGSGPVSVSFPLAPARGVQPKNLVALAGGIVFCVPCDSGGDPPPDPCASIVCDDGNPCTADSCSQGGCVFTPINDACCNGSIATALAGMQEGLLAIVNAEGLTTNLQLDEPVPNASGGDIALSVFNDTGTARTGTSSVACGTGAGNVLVTFEVTDEDPSGGGITQGWTLVMSLWQDGTMLHLDGTMMHVVAFGATTTYTGGWTYSDADGPLLDPASEVGFPEAVAAMFNLGLPPGGATAAAGGFFGSLISLIGNVVQITINYIRDIGIPYTPPIFCLGPNIDTSRCASGAISCLGVIGDLALKIDQIPNVSLGFKKCMKGRMGCGGSHHPRIRTTCRSSNDCGPCAAFRPGALAGCSLGGTTNWYCNSSLVSKCVCSRTIFHEASHSCGTLDLQNGARNDSYRIGDWFEDEYQSDQGLNEQCRPR